MGVSLSRALWDRWVGKGAGQLTVVWQRMQHSVPEAAGATRAFAIGSPPFALQMMRSKYRSRLLMSRMWFTVARSAPGLTVEHCGYLPTLLFRQAAYTVGVGKICTTDCITVTVVVVSAVAVAIVVGTSVTTSGAPVTMLMPVTLTTVCTE
jgi:hypothetical protein